MWVFMSDSALSIVKYQGDPALGDALMVRSRTKGDVEQFIELATSDDASAWRRHFHVSETPDNDYRYRTLAPRWLVNECLIAYVNDLQYPNFKNSVYDHFRHNAYSGVWQVMYRNYGGYGNEGLLGEIESSELEDGAEWIK